MKDPIRKKEVARILGVCPDSVDKARKEGNLPPCSPRIPGGVHLFWEREDIVFLSKCCPCNMEEFNKLKSY